MPIPNRTISRNAVIVLRSPTSAGTSPYDQSSPAATGTRTSGSGRRDRNAISSVRMMPIAATDPARFRSWRIWTYPSTLFRSDPLTYPRSPCRRATSAVTSCRLANRSRVTPRFVTAWTGRTSIPRMRPSPFLKRGRNDEPARELLVDVGRVHPRLGLRSGVGLP